MPRRAPALPKTATTGCGENHQQQPAQSKSPFRHLWPPSLEPVIGANERGISVQPSGVNSDSGRLAFFALQPLLHLRQFFVPIRGEARLAEGVEQQVERFDQTANPCRALIKSSAIILFL